MWIGLVLFLALATTGCLAQSTCEESSCYPATGDLLIGRQHRLVSTSTCGFNRPERYCIVSHLDESKKCFVCDSTRPFVDGVTSTDKSHRVENVVNTGGWISRKKTWWQSVNGVANVSIRLDMEAEFHFTHLIMTFKSFRPSAMFIEKSSDFGKSWKIYRYFAKDCEASFPNIPQAPLQFIGQVVCESRYSDVAPSEGGEVIYIALPPSISPDDPYSPEVQDLLKMTNLRINFTELHTLGDNLLDQREEIKEKYYYAIYDVVVRGSCSCYGHASRCLPLEGQTAVDVERASVVYGRCECAHNTQGLNCELCENLYNDRPWAPARERNPNACKRCQCYDHAAKCHFDPAVYEESGYTSGGVCDDCRHNTMGRHCEQCKPFFYHVPDKDMNDPYSCEPCNCDPIGSLNDGECDPSDDPDYDLQAGRCHCKTYVGGQRCDSCLDGYWNMDPSDPDGCQECTCNILGTVGNTGCDKYTGECICKRKVAGRDCNECLPEHYGLSEDPEGCKACNCDLGGAYDNNCDIATGQCSCKNHMGGRQCNEPDPNYFCVYLDYFTFEAEDARGNDLTVVEYREPYPDREPTWTGPGFMKVQEGGVLEFFVAGLHTSMEYDIIIRYEPRMPNPWDSVRITIERPGPVDPTGQCGNTIPNDDYKYARMDPANRYQVVTPSVCLERGVAYTIKLEFDEYRRGEVNPSAAVFVDSIVLAPNIDQLSMFSGDPVKEYYKREFTHYRCDVAQLQVTKPELHPSCSKYICSISAILTGGAESCDCNLEGSSSNICDKSGGHCLCKPNVIGRECDQCAPGTWGFGPDGCTPCNCNQIGARNSFCEDAAGQCDCIPNVYGKQCDQCEPGFWNFPDCRPCECNGHAALCDQRSGACIDCQDHTDGGNCERCIDGYVGDPTNGLVGCRSCMCPGGPDSAFQFADTCYMDPRNQQVICNCWPGFSGIRCDRCDENYYGSPLQENGTCTPCDCSNNVDIAQPGNCERETGDCLRCLYNTAGPHCEYCRDGYYGDALEHDCAGCTCNILGTNHSAGACDLYTGQCQCLPNVINQYCDECALNHWKIASGEGCESCACDPEGSLSEQCNQFDGQCECREGRGGRDCAACKDDYWGDPAIDECYACDCDQQGSATRQCDRRTGQCVCLPGITGWRCDACQRGTTGELPNCVPCGECFDNWDMIISGLMNDTQRLIADASNLKQTGATGAYDDEFKAMEEKLDRVQRVLDSAGVTQQDVHTLHDVINKLSMNLTTNKAQLQQVNMKLHNTTTRTEQAEGRLRRLKDQADSLQTQADDLRNNATEIKEGDLEGAFNITREAQRRSQAAQAVVRAAGDTVRHSQAERRRVDNLIADSKSDFDRKYQENEVALNDIEDKVMGLKDQIADINDLVCDGRGDPCDGLCGGAGCGKCGGLSCDGAADKAKSSLDLAQETEAVLDNKGKVADEMLAEVGEAKISVAMAKDDSQLAYDKAMMARNMSDDARSSLEGLIQDITDFLDAEGATPPMIRELANEVLGMSISLQPDQIRDLAQQINETIKSLTDIDAILNATAGDLATAEGLKDRADKAKESADEILGVAQGVLEALAAAKEAQDKAQQAIDNATDDIDAAKSDLDEIMVTSDMAMNMANQSMQDVTKLRARLAKVKTQFTQNEINVKKSADEAQRASELTHQADEDARVLEEKFGEVKEELDEKASNSESALDRAEVLRTRASALADDTGAKLSELRGMVSEFVSQERLLQDLTAEIMKLSDRMTGYLGDIDMKADHYRDCRP